MEQATVVEQGMSWTEEANNKALASHNYIKIGRGSGHLLLSGAPGRWKKSEFAGDVYIPSLRVAGNPNTIRELFISLRYPPSNIDQHLAASYTLGNYKTTMKGNFDAEVESYKVYKKQKDMLKKSVGGPTILLSDLEYYIRELPRARVALRTTTRESLGVKARGLQPLAARLAKLTAGKVLDVSKMDMVKFTGIKSMPRPGANSSKIGVANLNIVSSDPVKYAKAIELLGPDYTHFLHDYNVAVQRKTVVIQAPPTVPLGRQGVPTLPTATSPLIGGGSLPMIPGILGSPTSPRF